MALGITTPKIKPIVKIKVGSQVKTYLNDPMLKAKILTKVSYNVSIIFILFYFPANNTIIECLYVANTFLWGNLKHLRTLQCISIYTYYLIHNSYISNSIEIQITSFEWLIFCNFQFNWYKIMFHLFAHLSRYIKYSWAKVHLNFMV